MEDPSSPPKFRRTCPACNRPVEPGYKFCETCGTRIPELSTCSKCGTQFMAPVKYCDLCGAPVIPGKVPEPDDSPEHSEEEDTRLVEGQSPEQDGEEIPEPDTDESPGKNDEETTKPAEDQIPQSHKLEIQEPDTDELLEQYGKEYGEDETLASGHTPEARVSVKYETKKPVTVSGQPELRSSDAVDDVLFLAPGKQKTPVKPPINRTMVIVGCIVLIAMSAAVYFIGLPMLTNKNPPAPEITPVPEPTSVLPSLTKTPVPASRALVPLPTQIIPSSPDFNFYIQKNPVTSKILIIYTGSGIINADIRVTHPEGSFASGIISPLKGINEITLDGSPGTDRVEIIAQISDGRTYRVRDELISSIGN